MSITANCNGGGLTGCGDLFDLPELIHGQLAGLEGNTFADFALSESVTNHNHEDIVESIEVYEFVAFKSIGK